MSGSRQFHVHIPQEVYDKVMHWVNKGSIEVSGFGKVIFDEENLRFTVVDAYLLDQEGGSAHTDIDETALGRLMYQTKDVEGDLRWWWHSHVKMPVFWSGIDTDTIKTYGANGWLLATVFNQKYEMRSAVGHRVLSILGVEVQVIDNIETEITRYIDPRLEQEWDELYTTHVKEKKFTPTTLIGDKAWDGHWDGNTYIGGAKHYKEEETLIAEMLGNDTDYSVSKRDPGWLGYGVTVEAKALGMTAEAYVDLLNSSNHAKVDRVIEKLERLEKQGKLKYE